MIAVAIEEKRCRVCGEYYPLTEFHRKSSGKYGRDTICRSCKSAYEMVRQKEERREKGMEGSYSPADPWHDLACAILQHAANDWQYVRRTGKYKQLKNNSEITRQEMLLGAYPDARHEMLTFFWSMWFEFLCDLAGFEPDWVRQKLQVPRLLV